MAPISSVHHAITAFTCQEVVLRFTAHFDAQEYTEMEQYFAVDGIWERREGNIFGTAGLRSYLATRPDTIFVRHILSNLRTTIKSTDHATVDSYLVAYRHDFTGSIALPAPLAHPLLVGRYHDELQCQDGAWRIQLRQVHIDFLQ